MDRAAPLGESSDRSYHIRTYGCQMNLADSERMAGVLEAGGYRCTTDPEAADVLVFNTCSIREKAEAKVYSALGLQAKRKRQRPGGLKIVVAGCVAQQARRRLCTVPYRCTQTIHYLLLHDRSSWIGLYHIHLAARS